MSTVTGPTKNWSGQPDDNTDTVTGSPATAHRFPGTDRPKPRLMGRFAPNRVRCGPGGPGQPVSRARRGAAPPRCPGVVARHRPSRRGPADPERLATGPAPIPITPGTARDRLPAPADRHPPSGRPGHRTGWCTDPRSPTRRFGNRRQPTTARTRPAGAPAGRKTAPSRPPPRTVRQCPRRRGRRADPGRPRPCGIRATSGTARQHPDGTRRRATCRRRHRAQRSPPSNRYRRVTSA